MRLRVWSMAALAAVLVAGCTAEPKRETPDPFAAGRSEPVADPVYPQRGNPSIDVLHYDLDLSWAPDETTTLTGLATLTVRVVAPVREVSLDFAADMAVEKASIDGAPTTPQRRGEKLILPAPRELAADSRVRVEVRYRGVPKQVPMPSTRADGADGLGLRPADRGAAWTMQEPFGAFTWYPCNDHPSDEALFDVHLAAPAGWAGVAGGTFDGVRDGKAQFRSTEPTATYLTTLAFGRYQRTDLAGPRGMPVALWTRPEDAAVLPLLKRVPQHLEWLEKRFGEYPFSSAGVVMVPARSAMETQELVTMGALGGGLPAQQRERLFAVTLVHELAHHWFGDSVTPKDWRAVWLNEGWATFADGQFKIDSGFSTTEEWVAELRAADARSRARAGPPGNFDPKHFAETNVYVGPALMLQEIRGLVGDDAFFALAKDWVQTQRDSHQDRASFTAFVNRHTGRDLTPVIDKWLDSRTTPK